MTFYDWSGSTIFGVSLAWMWCTNFIRVSADAVIDDPHQKDTGWLTEVSSGDRVADYWSFEMCSSFLVIYFSNNDVTLSCSSKDLHYTVEEGNSGRLGLAAVSTLHLPDDTWHSLNLKTGRGVHISMAFLSLEPLWALLSIWQGREAREHVSPENQHRSQFFSVFFFSLTLPRLYQQIW